jgi:hypothetical protein
MLLKVVKPEISPDTLKQKLWVTGSLVVGGPEAVGHVHRARAPPLQGIRGKNVLQ